jgi:hypothetical protein
VSRIFLLSPAHCGGERARFLFNDAARFELALRVRKREGVPLGEIFTFLSGLYFRGKLAYARAFARPPEGVPGVLIITANDGLRTPEHPVNLKTLRRYARGSIDEDNAGYRRPLLRDARLVEAAAGPGTEVVLLGSVASGKYVDVLVEVFGDRLRFPSTFVGRGDMSRGGLMLRSVDAGRELDYVPVAGAVRHGPRPPRLEPRRWTRAR